jgi:predicted N-acetyltransferase YhbS
MNSTAPTSTKSGRETTVRSATDSLPRHSHQSVNDSRLGVAPVTPRFGTEQAFRIVPARAGDHHDLHALLVSVLHQPGSAEFHAQLDDPFYEPGNRLLVKRHHQIVAHARVAHREMHFGGGLIPVSTLSDLVVLPEYRSEGCAAELVKAAEQSIVETGSRMAFLRTRQPEFFAKLGWTTAIRRPALATSYRGSSGLKHRRTIRSHLTSFR